MTVIAITGLMGSGKSETLRLLQKKGYPVLQADQLVKSLLQPTSPCFKELKDLLPPTVFTKKGGICIKKVAKEVFFKNPSTLKQLEGILHPLVREQLRDFVEQKKTEGESYVFYEIPLLSQKSLLKNRFDHLILLTRPKAAIIKSLVQKGWKIKDVQARLKRQENGKSIQKKADFVLQNKGNLKELSLQLERILKHPVFSHLLSIKKP